MDWIRELSNSPMADGQMTRVRTGYGLETIKQMILQAQRATCRTQWVPLDWMHDLHGLGSKQDTDVDAQAQVCVELALVLSPSLRMRVLRTCPCDQGPRRRVLP
eukprot:1557340-Amphidinium_carterae.1